jgi:pimeloyl-ACP methyl ester carboxylesterase
MAEIHRREPNYSSFFPITVSYEGMIPAYQQGPISDQLSPEAITQALTQSFEYIAQSWERSEKVSTASDPMAQFLCDSIIDAYCAEQGLLGLRPQASPNKSISDTLAQEYSQRKTPGGLSYYIRNRGDHPLVLINATGTPVAIWNQFLADGEHEFRIILPQRRGSDFIKGGLRQFADIRTESDDLAQILEAESISQTDILGWCNGGRIAIELADCRAASISSMVLLGPMLKSVKGVDSNPSTFERDLQPMLEAVAKQPSLAPVFSKAISQTSAPPWDRWRDAPVSRARALFPLPAKEHVCGMFAPIGDAESFLNIARRVASDESYSMAEALGRLNTRTLVIMGSDDNIVSNALVRLAMNQLCQSVIMNVVLEGGGHYIQDLQYHYFRWLLTEFLQKRRSPTRTARVSVETFGP